MPSAPPHVPAFDRLFHIASEPLTATLELEIVAGHDVGRVMALGGHRPHVLGRGVNCDVRFDPRRAMRVSSSHAEVVVNGDQAWIRDLGSRNGTWINGRPIREPTRLLDGDRITLGAGGPELVARLLRPESDAVPTPPPSAPESTLFDTLAPSTLHPTEPASLLPPCPHAPPPLRRPFTG